MTTQPTTDVHHVTTVHVPVVLYDDGPECPVCGRPRIWRETEVGWECGRGEDAGRVMGLDEPCAPCRRMVDGLDECAGAATITDEQLEDLRTEAAAAGDMEQVAICDVALLGGVAAREECERVISDAAAAAVE